MSLYGALNIGVAGLAANAQALSATSANIANVNTVGYKTQNANFQTFLNVQGLVGSAGAGVSSVISQDVTAQGLPTATSSPTDMSISGNGFFVVASNTSATAQQQYTRAGSFTPDESGNLKNSAGLYLLGYKLDSAGNVPTDTSALSLINTTSLAGKAQATTTMGLQANLQASSAATTAYTAGDMASGAVTPDSSAPSMSITARAAPSRSTCPSSRPAPTSGPMKPPMPATRPRSPAPIPSPRAPSASIPTVRWPMWTARRPPRAPSR